MFQKLKLHWLPQRTWHLMLISGFLQCFAGLTWLYIGNLSRFLGDWTVERAIVLGAIHGFCKGAFFVGLPVSIILFGIAIRRHVRFTAVEQGAASPSVPRFRRVAVAVALVVPLLQAWLLFDLAPQRRCRMAMQPFVDASGELVVRINELADRGKLDEASALIPSYRLIRGQGFLAAATEWIGSNGRKRMTQFGLNDPIWEISQRGRQSLIQRLRQDGSPRNTELADSLSHFKVEQLAGISTRSQIDELANELAGWSGETASESHRLVVLPAPIDLKRRLIVVELEASKSYLGGEHDSSFGIHRWIDPQHQSVTPTLWDATDSAITQHFSKSTRKAIQSAQKRYNLRTELVCNSTH